MKENQEGKRIENIKEGEGVEIHDPIAKSVNPAKKRITTSMHHMLIYNPSIYYIIGKEINLQIKIEIVIRKEVSKEIVKEIAAKINLKDQSQKKGLDQKINHHQIRIKRRTPGLKGMMMKKVVDLNVADQKIGMKINAIITQMKVRIY